jgi:hypothetical protein
MERIMGRCAKALIGAAAALTVALMPAAGEAAPKNILVVRGSTEPVVLADPHHPARVVVASNPAVPVNAKYPMTFYVSGDGGRTFTHQTAPLTDPYAFAADPSLGVADNGTIFFGYEAATPTYCGGGPGSSAIFVASAPKRSDTFRAPVLVDSATFDDKPFLTVESSPGKASHVFIVWSRYQSSISKNLVLLARSTDGGVTFGAPVTLNASTGDTTGAIPVVGPGHHIYVFWPETRGSGLAKVGSTSVYMMASADDGQHFDAPRVVAGPFGTLPAMLEPGDLRTPELVSAAATPKGRLYLTWTAVSHDYGQGTVDADIMVSSSTNHGTSWTTPERVNDVSRGDRFMPALSTYPDGSAGLAFYDRRAGAENLAVYAAHVSFVGGYHRTANLRLTADPSPVADIYEDKPGHSKCFSPGRFFGDYIGTYAGRGRKLLVTWCDTQQQHQNETDVWLANVTLPRLAAGQRRPR